MSLEIENLPEAIRNIKKSLRQALPNYAQIFGEVEAEMRRRIDEVVKERNAGGAVIPEIPYADIAANVVTPATIEKI